MVFTLNDVVRVKSEDLLGFILNVLESVGVREKDAKIIAENIILANLRGVDSHGVVRLPSYVKRVMKKLIDPLSVKILNNEFRAGQKIEVGLNCKDLTFKVARA